MNIIQWKPLLLLERGLIFLYSDNKPTHHAVPLTWSRPSRVRWMVTHLLGWAPLVVMAVMSESSSSFFSFSFFTRLSMARLAKVSLSPPCLWHIRLCTMLRQASLLVGVFVIDILTDFPCHWASLKWSHQMFRQRKASPGCVLMYLFDSWPKRYVTIRLL